MIREAVEEDLPELVKIICEYVQEEKYEMTSDDRDVITAELKNGMKREDQDIFVATNEDDACVGYISVHWIPVPMLREPEGYISEIFVAKNYCGNGAGTDLMASVQREAEKRGCRRLMLNNHIGSTAYKRNFYPKRGFTHRTNFANYVKELK